MENKKLSLFFVAYATLLLIIAYGYRETIVLTFKPQVNGPFSSNRKTPYLCNNYPYTRITLSANAQYTRTRKSKQEDLLGIFVIDE